MNSIPLNSFIRFDWPISFFFFSLTRYKLTIRNITILFLFFFLLFSLSLPSTDKTRSPVFNYVDRGDAFNLRLIQARSTKFSRSQSFWITHTRARAHMHRYIYVHTQRDGASKSALQLHWLIPNGWIQREKNSSWRRSFDFFPPSKKPVPR